MAEENNVVETEETEDAQPESEESTIADDSSSGDGDEHHKPDEQLRKANTTARSAELAKRVFDTTKTGVEKLLKESRAQLSDDMPFNEWQKLRNDQLSGVEAERQANAAELGRVVRAALAQNSAANLQDALENAPEEQEGGHAPLTPAATGEDLDRFIEQQTEERISFRDHLSRVEQAKTSYPDWDEVAHAAMDAGMFIPPALGTVIQSLHNSADVMYELMKDQELARRLPYTSVPQGIAILAQLSVKAEAERPRPVSKAPAPPQPVRKYAPVEEDIGDPKTSFKTFVKVRNQNISRNREARGRR